MGATAQPGVVRGQMARKREGLQREVERSGGDDDSVEEGSGEEGSERRMEVE
jgi:hypothetical protein